MLKTYRLCSEVKRAGSVASRASSNPAQTQNMFQIACQLGVVM